MTTESIARDLLIILAAGLLAGLLCRRIGLSALVGYLLVGAVLGPGGVGLIHEESHEIAYLAEFGVLLLLFSIGLELSLENLARLRRYILVGGGMQMLLVAVPTTLAMLAWDRPLRPAILLGCAAAMSSTVLVFKALAEYGQTATPAGRRSISILLFQDVAVVPLLLLVPILSGTGDQSGPLEWLTLFLLTGVIVLGVLVLRLVVQRWAVPLLAGLRSPELVVLFALVMLGVITTVVHHAGLPLPLGAFAAGLILSGNRLSAQIDALILSFREAFAAVFFVSLGLLFDPMLLKNQPGVVAGGLIGILVLKFVAAAVAARMTGMRWKASAGVGLGLAQVGEFAFVLTFAGVEGGLLEEESYHFMVILALGSLIITPRMLRIGLRMAGAAIADESAPDPGVHAGPDTGRHTIVIGIGPVGRAVTRLLSGRGERVTAVDLSPVNLHPLAQAGLATVAGDAQDTALLRRARADKADLIIVSVPDDAIARRIVAAIRTLNKASPVVVRCRFLASVERMRKAGANAIISEEEQATDALLETLASLKP